MTAAAVLGGYGADLVFGDPARRHPVAGFGALAHRLEQTMHRSSRTVGVAYTSLLVGGAALVGRLAGGRALPLAAAVWLALGGRSLAREAKRVGALVEAGELPAAREAVSVLVGRDPSQLDGPELCRAAVESVAENTVDAVAAPLMWAAAMGAPGVLAYRAANTLDAMVGHRTERHARFGWASARLDDGLNWPAARLTALCVAALAPLVGGSPRRTWLIVRRDGARHPSPNGGRAEAAFAGALDLRLGGRNVYPERVEERPALGEGERPEPADVRRAVRLSQAVGGVSALAAAAARRLVAA
ncbi:MAG: adenosylcobinamide-phosphate synthase CbiB [Solirubrobacteraceae bacterium]